MVKGSVKRLARSVLPAPASAAIRRSVLRREAVLHVMETLVVNHCNLSCKGCNAWAPLSEPTFADPERFSGDVTRLAELFDRVDHFGVVGGEPLLHPRVLDFPRSIRREFPDADIYLVSNGLLMLNMPDEFFDELAELSVRINISSYPVKLDHEALSAKAGAHGVGLEYTESRDEFWTFPVRREGDRNPARSFAKCRELTNCPMLADGRIYTCGRAGLAPIFEASSGWDLPRTDRDSVDIYSNVNGFDVIEYLNRPIEWCRYCDVDHMKTFEWCSGARTYEDWT